MAGSEAKPVNGIQISSTCFSLKTHTCTHTHTHTHKHTQTNKHMQLSSRWRAELKRVMLVYFNLSHILVVFSNTCRAGEICERSKIIEDVSRDVGRQSIRLVNNPWAQCTMEKKAKRNAEQVSKLSITDIHYSVTESRENTLTYSTRVM